MYTSVFKDLPTSLMSSCETASSVAWVIERQTRSRVRVRANILYITTLLEGQMVSGGNKQSLVKDLCNTSPYGEISCC